MLDFKKAVMIMGGGVALIFSVALGYSVYVYNAGGESKSAQAHITVDPYVYQSNIHPGDGGFYYTDPTSGNTTVYWNKNAVDPIFDVYGQTKDAAGAVISVGMNADGLEVDSKGKLTTNRLFNSITVNLITNLITVNGATVSAQKLVLPTFFIDERDGTKYYVTRYDPEPNSGTKTTNKSLFGVATGSDYTTPNGGNAITELDFGANDKLRYVGTRAFAYLHNLVTMDLSSCSSLKYLDEWALCRCESLQTMSLPALSTTEGATYQGIYNSPKTMGTLLKGTFHHDTSFDTIDFRAQRGLITFQDNMFSDADGVNRLVLSTDLQAIRNQAFASRYGNGANVVSNRKIFFEGNGTQLQAILASSQTNKNWCQYQENWPSFDHMIHCLTAETDGTYKAATITSNNGGNASYTYATDTSGDQSLAPTPVVTNRFFYKAA
jgi:hypothetical protein